MLLFPMANDIAQNPGALSVLRCAYKEWNENSGWPSMNVIPITKQFKPHTSFLCNLSLCYPWRHQMETFSALLALCLGNSPVTGEFPHKGQWRRALMFSLICTWMKCWVDNHEAGDLILHRTHYDVMVMPYHGATNGMFQGWPINFAANESILIVNHGHPSYYYSCGLIPYTLNVLEETWKIYLHFPTFLNTKITEVVEFLPYARQIPI